MKQNELSPITVVARSKAWVAVAGFWGCGIESRSRKGLLLAHIIKKDGFKMEAGVGLSTSLSKNFVRMECI